MVPFRLVAIITAALLGLAFALGFLFWNTKPYACLDGKGYYGDWFTVYSIGKLDLRAKQFGCVSANRYDPKTFKSGVDLQHLPTLNQ